MSFTAIYRCRNYLTRRNVSVTNNTHCVGGTTGSGIDGYQMSVFRTRERGHKYQYADVNGLTVPNDGTCEKINQERGYIQPYTRNTIEFVGSPAYRRRAGMFCRPAGFVSLAERRELDWKTYRICYVDGIKIVIDKSRRIINHCWLSGDPMVAKLGLIERSSNRYFPDHYLPENVPTIAPRS